MKALTISLAEKITLSIMDKPMPLPGAGEVVVRMSAAALNRRDYWISQGKYPGLIDRTTIGSDGCGFVEGIGTGVNTDWIGKRVILNPSNSWGNNEDHQGDNYHILGLPTDGTIAEYMRIAGDRMVEAPKHLSDAEAAALPLAGLTAYRVVFTKAKVAKGQKVLVTGIGGGVSQFAFEFCKQEEADLYVTSGHEHKLEAAKAKGASFGVNYKDDEWAKKLKAESGGMDVIIDSVGGASLRYYVGLLNPGGTLVVYGATLGGSDQLDLAKVFWKQLRILGSTMGSDQEFAQMIDYVNLHKITPEVDSVRPFEKALEAVEEMGRGVHLGKLVLSF